MPGRAVRARLGSMSDPNDPAHLAEHEIRRFHEALVDWITGAMAEGDFDLAIGDALDPDMLWITPSGEEIARDNLTASLRRSHGANPDFRISIDEVRLVGSGPGLIVASYVEHQTGARNSPAVNIRVSTAVFSWSDRLRWRHLHETYR